MPRKSNQANRFKHPGKKQEAILEKLSSLRTSGFSLKDASLILRYSEVQTRQLNSKLINLLKYNPNFWQGIKKKERRNLIGILKKSRSSKFVPETILPSNQKQINALIKSEILALAMTGIFSQSDIGKMKGRYRESIAHTLGKLAKNSSIIRTKVRSKGGNIGAISVVPLYKKTNLYYFDLYSKCPREMLPLIKKRVNLIKETESINYGTQYETIQLRLNVLDKIIQRNNPKNLANVYKKGIKREFDALKFLSKKPHITEIKDYFQKNKLYLDLMRHKSETLLIEHPLLFPEMSLKKKVEILKILEDLTRRNNRVKPENRI